MEGRGRKKEQKRKQLGLEKKVLLLTWFVMWRVYHGLMSPMICFCLEQSDLRTNLVLQS